MYAALYGRHGSGADDWSFVGTRFGRFGFRSGVRACCESECGDENQGFEVHCLTTSLVLL